MRIFIAGATGTLGRPVVQLLVSHGHEVVGLTRSEAGRRLVEAAGARAVVGDALDGTRVCALVQEARPDQVVHLLTALPPAGPLRASQLRPTNELRIDATRNLLRAAVDAGASRLVAESFVGVYGGATSHLTLEDEPLPPVPDSALRDAILALRSLEDQLRAARTGGQINTVALRIGFLYGPDVPSTLDLIQRARAGRLFVPRDMSGMAPFVRNADAVAAIVAAIERPEPSFVYNVVDDEPMALGTFLTLLTRALGSAAPRRVPAWLVRIAAPLMAELGSAKLLLSNVKAKQELGWSLRYPTVEAGLADLNKALEKAA